jgi:hypothetical protein
MKYPEGFFRMAAAGRVIFCFHCSACNITYTDIAQSSQVPCCGKKKSYDGKDGIPTVEYGTQRGAAVDLSSPVRIAGRILGIVD